MDKKEKMFTFGVFVCIKHKGNTKFMYMDEYRNCEVVGCLNPAEYIGLVDGEVY